MGPQLCSSFISDVSGNKNVMNVIKKYHNETFAMSVFLGEPISNL